MPKIKLITNNKVLYEGDVKILKDLYMFGEYIFDKTIKRLISKDYDKETIVDISKKRITINQGEETVDLDIRINYYIEKGNNIEFDYNLDKDNFNVKIEVGDINE